MDGGMIANNPAIDAMTEIHRYYKHQNKRQNPSTSLQYRNSTASLQLYAEATEFHTRPEKLGLLLSLGTGQAATTDVGLELCFFLVNFCTPGLAG